MRALQAALMERGEDSYEGPDKIIREATRLLAVLRLRNEVPEPLGKCECGQDIYVTKHRDGEPGSECGGYGGEGICCIFGAAKPGPCDTCGDHDITETQMKAARDAHEAAFKA